MLNMIGVFISHLTQCSHEESKELKDLITKYFDQLRIWKLLFIWSDIIILKLSIWRNKRKVLGELKCGKNPFMETKYQHISCILQPTSGNFKRASAYGYFLCIVVNPVPHVHIRSNSAGILPSLICHFKHVFQNWWQLCIQVDLNWANVHIT